MVDMQGATDRVAEIHNKVIYGKLEVEQNGHGVRRKPKSSIVKESFRKRH